LAHTVTTDVTSRNASSSSCTCQWPTSRGTTSSHAQISSVSMRKRHWTNSGAAGLGMGACPFDEVGRRVRSAGLYTLSCGAVPAADQVYPNS
jgi:hypothetical protein